MNRADLKFSQRVNIKILVSITILIVLIETILLVFSTVNYRRGLFSLRNEIYQNIGDKKVNSAKDILSNQYIDLKVKTYPRNIILMVILIVFVVISGSHFIIQSILIKPILTIFNANIALSKGDEINSSIPEKEFPNNEIGMIMHSRMKMLENLEKSKDELKKLMKKEKELAATRATVIAERKKVIEIENLYNELKKAHSELKATQFRLTQAKKMQIIGKLASGVAHEVKNPLAIIVQGIDYLSKKVKIDDKNVTLTLSDMIDAAERANDIIKGLLDFSSLSKVELKLENLNSIIESSLLLVKNYLNLYHIELVKDFEKNIPQIMLDKNRIEQVFINLFMNAIQAMPRGGQLRVRTYVQETKKEGKTVVSEIEDTGPGIPEDVLGKIFEPFFTTKHGKEGTGLGLSIVKNIIEMHNGKIDIQDKKSGGLKATTIFKA